MGSEIVKKQPQALDNFDSFDDSVQGADDGHGAGIHTGVRLKYTNEARWETTPDGTDYTDRELTAINVRRTEIRWGDGRPEVRELAPGEQYRDLEALNATIPKSEWREGPDGRPRGPWQRQHILEFVDLNGMQRFWWPTSTVGGSRCITDLRDRIMLMRRFRGENVYPTVRLTHTFMPTRFGGRERPHLEVKAWIKIGGGEAEALPSPQAPLPPSQEQAAPPTAKAKPGEAKIKTQTVSEPSLEEELGDKLPY